MCEPRSDILMSFSEDHKLLAILFVYCRTVNRLVSEGGQKIRNTF